MVRRRASVGWAVNTGSMASWSRSDCMSAAETPRAAASAIASATDSPTAARSRARWRSTRRRWRSSARFTRWK